MRFLHLTINDFKFQKKYGILLMYAIFTLFYIFILKVIPSSISIEVGTILVYTDPAAMGLFFMGAIILLEKSQKINFTIVTSPISVNEYILSKCLSIMITSTIVGTLIMLIATETINILGVISISLSSILFSLCGLFVASKVNSLNKFSIFTVPFELAISLPAIVYILGYLKEDIFILHPGIASMKLLTSSNSSSLLCIISIIFWAGIMMFLTNKSIKKHYFKMGGKNI